MGEMKRNRTILQTTNQLAGPDSDEPACRSTLDLNHLCCACGGPLLGFDPEDTLDAEGPGRHLCGNCYRAREWDAIESFEGDM
jgi:hypothetical protein